jgi:SPX domain protein involved in polyphosphate accumulation
MSNLSHTIRKFNRFELKYLITMKQAEQFKKDLKAFLVPDEHGNNQGRYSLASLYFDSPELRCYWEKEHGIKFRRKLRMRLYETGHVVTEETPVFVEIKQRVDRVTQKRRALLTYRDALVLCNDRQIPDHDSADKEVIEEINAFTFQYNLCPTSIVRYDRQAFMGSTYDIGLRVTFDTMLTAQAHPLHLHEAHSGMLMLPGNYVVMEIKVNDRIPTWLVSLIAAHNLQMTRVSKYCRSIEASWDLPGFRRGNPLPERSLDILDTVPSLYKPSRSKLEVRRKFN